jgi:hypothetical protein
MKASITLDTSLKSDCIWNGKSSSTEEKLCRMYEMMSTFDYFTGSFHPETASIFHPLCYNKSFIIIETPATAASHQTGERGRK